MTGTILDDLKRLGVRFELTCDRDLRLVAKRGVLTPEWIEMIRIHKPELIEVLWHEKERPWDGDDWRTFFDERAAVIECDGGYPRDLAERCALEECILEWLVRNPPSIGRSETCPVCGDNAEPVDHICLEVMRDGFVFGHRRCEETWRAWRRAEALDALAGRVPGPT